MRIEAAGNQSLVRITNQRLIIGKLRREGKMSRADLAKQLKLSSPAVSSNIAAMLEKGLLIELGEGESSGGRKPQMLVFNSKFRYIVSAVMSRNLVTLAIGDLQPQILCSRNYGIDDSCPVDEVFSKVCVWIEELLAEFGISRADLLGISVVTPGIIDTATGRIIRIHPKYFNWGDLPVKLLLEEHFGVRVFVRNDVDASAVAEHEYGAGEGCRNLVFMDFSPGVGAGIIIDGKLHKGSNNCAGEIGYMTAAMDVLDQPCIGEGYLETHASIPYVLKSIKSLLGSGEESMLSGLSDISFSDAAKAYLAGDRLCTGVIRQLAKQVAVAIANTNCVVDAEMFILGGKITALGDSFLNRVNGFLKAVSVTIPKIRYSTLGENECIFGGFAAGMDYLYEYIGKNL